MSTITRHRIENEPTWVTDALSNQTPVAYQLCPECYDCPRCSEGQERNAAFKCEDHAGCENCFEQDILDLNGIGVSFSPGFTIVSVGPSNAYEPALDELRHFIATQPVCDDYGKPV